MMKDSYDILRFSSVPLMPWTDIENSSGTIRYGTGLFSQLVNTLSTYSKFSYLIKQPPDRQWGSKGESGWTGMMGMVDRNESDIAMGPFAMNLDRYTVADFSILYITNYLTILAAKPENDPIDMFRSIQTFDAGIWTGLLSGLLIYTFLTTLTERMANSDKKDKKLRSKSAFLSFDFYFWKYLGSLFCESNLGDVKMDSSRILVGLWWLAILVLMNGFSGALKASLMVKLEQGRIDSVKDLVAKPSIIPYVHQGTAYETYIKSSNLPEFKRLWARVESMNSSLNQVNLYTRKTISEVLQGKAVIVSDVHTMKYFVSRYCRDLSGSAKFYFSKQTFFHHGFTMSISRTLSPTVIRKFKLKSRKIIEAGLFENWVDNLYRNWSFCSSQKAGQEEKPLALEDCQGIIYLLLMCLGASVVALIGELSVNCCCKKKLTRKRNHSQSIS